MIRAARVARKFGIPVVADLEKNSDGQFSTLLGLVDHLIISQSFAKELTGEKNAARAAQSLWTSDRKVVAVTCGEKGCWYVVGAGKSKPRHQPAFKVKVVDTTGCGDVFHGAYAAALARGNITEECLRFASVAAALKATRPGAQNGIPRRATVEAFLSATEQGVG